MSWVTLSAMLRPSTSAATARHREEGEEPHAQQAHAGEHPGKTQEHGGWASDTEQKGGTAWRST